MTVGLEYDCRLPWHEPMTGKSFMCWQSGWGGCDENKWVQLRALEQFGFPQKLQNDSGFPEDRLPLVPAWVNWVAHACVCTKTEMPLVFGAGPLLALRDAVITLGEEYERYHPEQFLRLVVALARSPSEALLAALRLGGPDAVIDVLRAQDLP